MFAEWQGVVSGNGLILPNSSGNGTIETCYDDINSLPRVPETTLTFLDISCPGALNNPVRVPVAIRVKDTIVNTTDIFSGDYILHPCVPNPFNSSTTISYTLTESTDLSLKIYNQLGQEVRNLFLNKKMNPGEYSEEWDGRDNFGNPLDAGLYICQLTANGITRTSNVVLIR
jgi:hypothetical protein